MRGVPCGATRGYPDLRISIHYVGGRPLERAETRMVLRNPLNTSHLHQVMYIVNGLPPEDSARPPYVPALKKIPTFRVSRSNMSVVIKRGALARCSIRSVFIWISKQLN